MPDIDDRFIDVDFRTDPRYVFGDTGRKTFGRVFAQRLKDAIPLVPRSQWEAEFEKTQAAGGGAERLVTRIYDQGSEGSCVANASSQAHEIVQAKEFGKDKVVHLSAISLYKRIGRSPQSGSSCDDALDEGTTRGILPLDTPENRARFGDAVMPNTGFYKPYPANWEPTAKFFRYVERLIIEDMDEMGTALANQLPVVVGRQGHSICYVGQIWKNGRRLAPYPNSWSMAWGAPMGDMPGGFGFDSENQIAMSADWAFALRTITNPSR